MTALRSVAFLPLLALGLNAIVGAGIFLNPGRLAALLGAWSIPFVVACGALLMAVAQAFSKLASLTERNGGPYLYAELAFGKRWAFSVGWVAWFCAAVSAGAVASALVYYVEEFTGAKVPELWGQASVALLVLLFGAINYLGVQYGSRVMTLLTWAKMLPLIVLPLAMFLLTPSGLITTPTGAESAVSWSGLQGALALTLFTFQGFEVVPIIAGETVNPRKDIPRATLLSLALSIVLYATIQFCVLHTPAAVGSSTPLAALAASLLGAAGGKLVAAAGILSIVGYVAGTMLASPRFLTPLAEDELIPGVFARTHAQFKTPHIAIVATTLLILGFVFIGEVGILMSMAALAVAMQYFTSSLALMVLARRGKIKGFYSGLASLIVSAFFLVTIEGRAWMLFVGATLGLYIVVIACKKIFGTRPSSAA